MMDETHDIEKTLDLNATIRDYVPGTARTAIRIEQSSESFTYLHTAIEFAPLVYGTGNRNGNGNGSNGNGRHGFHSTGLSDASLFQETRPVVLGVTSSIAGEGKTTVALHLAMDIARNNFKKVCLIDMSLGEDTLSRRLEINTGMGLVDVLEGNHHTIPTIEALDCEGLSIMPAGRTPNNAARAARSPSVPEILAASREMYDVIIVDMPSVASGNVLPITPYLDAAIMVVYSGVTPKDLVATAIERLGQIKILGVVMNRMTTSVPSWIERKLNRW
jgi:Mrp family chromosome partitioning ATPase